MPLLIGLLSLTCCAQTSASEPVATSAAVNPCTFIQLDDIAPARRAQLATEMAAAPDAAEWPRDIAGYLKLRAAVMACQIPKG